MPRNVLVRGKYPWWNLAVYSKYLTVRKPNPHRMVMPMKRRNFPKSRRTREAQASTIVMDELMRITVLSVARGTFR